MYRASICLVFVQHSHHVQLFRAPNGISVNCSALMFMYLELLEHSLKASFGHLRQLAVGIAHEQTYANQLISQSCLSAHQHLNKLSTNGCSPLSLLLTIVRSKRLQLDWQSGLSACIVIEIKIWGQLWLP